MLIRQLKSNEVSFDDETDILIIGGGGAGLTASVAASQYDVDVLVLEKQEILGGNTNLSHASVLAADTYCQQKEGIEDSADIFANELIAHTGFEEEVTRRVAKESGYTINWLNEQVGMDFQVVPAFLTNIEGFSAARRHHTVDESGQPRENGEYLIQTLEAEARKRGVEIRTDTPVEQLILDGDRVNGVVTEGEPSGLGRLNRKMIKSDKVLLATNGIAGDVDLRNKYFEDTDNLEYWASKGVTGDGIRWAEKLNADINLVEEGCSIYPLISQPEGFLLPSTIARMDGAIIVNTSGEQFGNILRTNAPLRFSKEILSQPTSGAYIIMDEFTYNMLMDLPFTSPRFRAAVEEGIFEKGDSIAEIAESLDIEATELADTIEEINSLAKQGEPDEYGHQRDQPINAPFYGTNIKPGIVENKGGIKVDDSARVITNRGKPIPNLLAAGSVTCAVVGPDPEQYVGGGRMLNVLCLGRIMGETAAEEITSG